MYGKYIYLSKFSLYYNNFVSTFNKTSNKCVKWGALINFIYLFLVNGQINGISVSSYNTTWCNEHPVKRQGLSKQKTKNDFQET